MKEISISSLRWVVQLCNQQQLPAPNGPGVINTYVNVAEVHADIQPVSTAQFLLGVQTEFMKITHVIILRATGNYLNRFTYVIRERLRPDQSLRTEIFRVHRCLEIEGRQRFLKAEAELITSG